MSHLIIAIDPQVRYSGVAYKWADQPIISHDLIDTFNQGAAIVTDLVSLGAGNHITVIMESSVFGASRYVSRAFAYELGFLTGLFKAYSHNIPGQVSFIYPAPSHWRSFIDSALTKEEVQSVAASYYIYRRSQWMPQEDVITEHEADAIAMILAYELSGGAMSGTVIKNKKVVI